MNGSDLKFLVDVGVGKKVEAWLAANGYDVVAVRDLDPRMDDQDILRLAANESRMVISMDKDFGEMVYHSGLSHAGVLLLRLEAATGDEKAIIVAEILKSHSGQLVTNFCVFQNGRLRIRRG